MTSLHLRARAFLVAFSLSFLLLPAIALAGQVRGHVTGPDGQPLPGVQVELSSELSGYSQLATTTADGAFEIYNVPDNPYHLLARLDGFADAHEDIDVRGKLPVVRSIQLVAQFAEDRTVVAERESVALEKKSATSHIDIDKTLIHRFPAQSSSRAFESIVLSAPGFSQDENGRYHFQGGHSQQLLVIDGQPIGDQVGLTFSNSLNPAIVEGMEIQVGGVAAEFGEKANGVINLTTRSALGVAGIKGDLSGEIGSFKALGGNLALGKGSQRSGIFLALDASKSYRFLDPISFGNLHNHGESARGFLRYDWLSVSGADSLRTSGSSGTTRRDVTNLPSQEEAGQDQRVESKDWNVNVGWQRVTGKSAVLEGQVFARNGEFELFSSPGDTPVLASQQRSLANRGANASYTRLFGSHEVKIGFQAKSFPIDENFSFAVTDPDFNNPDGEEFNPNLAAFDITRGGSPFAFSGEKSGNYGALYAQDIVTFENLTLNVGLRYDRNRLFKSESLLQPRLGLAYNIPASHTVLRASYDRMLVTPEYENILLSSSSAAAALAPPEIQEAVELGGGRLFNTSEKHDSYSVGIQQGIGSGLRLDLSYWNRQIDSSADQGQFFNTGIVFPLNFQGADLSGWNLRADFGPFEGIRGYLSLGHVHALYEGPVTGGLFLEGEALDSLTGGKFVIDHDQDLQEQLGVYWDIAQTGFWIGLTQRYDSGLVADAGSLEDVLASTDTDYAAPYLDFDGDPQRVKSRNIWNLSIGAKLSRYGLPFEVELSGLNLADEKGLYNFQSVFGGTHVIPPRSFVGKIRFLF